MNSVTIKETRVEFDFGVGSRELTKSQKITVRPGEEKKRQAGGALSIKCQRWQVASFSNEVTQTTQDVGNEGFSFNCRC